MPAVTWDDGARSVTTTYERSDAGAASLTAPIVFLVHGAAGNIHHFRDPARSPGFNADQTWRPPGLLDLGWHDVPPLPMLFVEDPPMSVEGIEPFLVRNGYRTVNYSQTDPSGLLRRPVLEFGAIYDQVRADFPDAPIHIVCHSRGGLLIRRWLATERWRRPSTKLRPIKTVQTLSTPHRGSSLADLMIFLEHVGAFFTEGPWGLGAFMDRYRSSSVMTELAVGDNQFLKSLEFTESHLPGAREDKDIHPGIDFYPFAGNAPRLARHHLYQPTWMSAVPHWKLQPFNWTAFWGRAQIDVPDVLGNNLPLEARPGFGDVLVTVARAVPETWKAKEPVAVFPVNHSSVLWDPAVKARLLRNLGGPQPVALAVGTLTVPKPSLVSDTAQSLRVTATNAGLNVWSNHVSVRTADDFPAPAWSAPTGALVPGSSTLLMQPLPGLPRGTYEMGWDLHHAQAGVLERVRHVVRVVDECTALAAKIDQLEEQMREVPSARGATARDKAAWKKGEPSPHDPRREIAHGIAQLRVRQEQLGCPGVRRPR